VDAFERRRTGLGVRVLWRFVRRSPRRAARDVLVNGGPCVVLLGLLSARWGASIAIGLSFGVVLVWWHLRSWERRLVDLAREIGPISTDRLVLRAVTKDDVDGVADTIDEDVIVVNGWPEHMKGDWLRDVARADRDPVVGRWLITVAATREIVGSMGMNMIDPAARTCELGWWIGPTGRGRGYATEALRATLDALHANGLVEVRIGTAEDNVAIRRILEKVGATFVEVRPHRLPNGVTEASSWYVHRALAG
jgi:RimJ/RimL family protein N-acetyltransferase